MLILSCGEDVRDLVPADDRITLIHLPEKRSVGSKRNFGCEQATSEIVCHWDDDDWSEPERIATQVGTLLAKPEIEVTGFRTMRFTDGVNAWMYAGPPNYVLGTSLCYWRDWWLDHRFEAKDVGEDNAFVYAAHGQGVLFASDDSTLMQATIHESNTSPRRLGTNWTPL